MLPVRTRELIERIRALHPDESGERIDPTRLLDTLVEIVVWTQRTTPDAEVLENRVESKVAEMVAHVERRLRN